MRELLNCYASVCCLVYTNTIEEPTFYVWHKPHITASAKRWLSQQCKPMRGINISFCL